MCATRAVSSAKRRSRISWLHCFGVDRETSKIKQAATETILNVDCIVTIKICGDLLEHHAEEDGEEDGCQDAPLFHAVGDWEGCR